MQERSFHSREDAYFSDIFKIAIGVFVGALAAMFAYETINVWRVEYAARKLVHQVEQQEKASRAQAALQQQQQREDQERRREEQQALRRANELVQRLERERTARKEAAWAAFYQPSASCRVDAVTTVCANEHIAAKRRFDAQYVDR